MSQVMTIELPDKVYAALRLAAERAGMSPANLIANHLADEFQESVAEQPSEESVSARPTVRSFFGIFSSGDPHAADNERIDADLAREYADTHAS